MGNASSKDRHDDTVDFGALSPQGIYTGPQDWNREMVGRLIVERKLAPFYRPLEDYEEGWDDEQILAARKELPPAPPSSSANHQTAPLPQELNPPVTPSSSLSHRPHSSKSARAASKEPQRTMSEAKVYHGAVECPICFMYYPPNINRSRCCDQAICTECFVQIKRSEPTPTHIESEPACCPYCVQDNFGVVYSPPSWRVGINSDATMSSRLDMAKNGSNYSGEITPANVAARERRKSTSHTSEDVVTTDQIRPDWKDKLDAVKAAVTRRANRRIIMRQVGDRLVPIGVTSGRIQVMDDGGDPGAGEEMSSGRRSRRRPPPPGELGDLLQSMGMRMGGQDLDELLLQEAMRLSLLEHEAEQKKQQADKMKDQAAANGQGPQENEAGPSGSADDDHSSAVATPTLQPTSAASTRGPSPMPCSHLPISPSPLANSSAAIALGISLPRGCNLRNSSGPQLSPNPDSSSRSHSRKSSGSHSPNGSQPAPAFNTLAAAVNAATIANAVFASGGPSASERRTREASEDIPPLPVVVPSSDLFEDVVTSQNGHSSGNTSTIEELPAVIEGVTATSSDVPSPPSSHAPEVVVDRTGAARLSRPQLTPHQTGISSHAAPGIVVHSASSRSISTTGGETDDTSTEDESMDGSGGALDYKILPSTPNLTMADPLISGSASVAGRSIGN